MVIKLHHKEPKIQKANRNERIRRMAQGRKKEKARQPSSEWQRGRLKGKRKGRKYKEEVKRRHKFLREERKAQAAQRWSSTPSCSSYGITMKHASWVSISSPYQIISLPGWHVNSMEVCKVHSIPISDGGMIGWCGNGMGSCQIRIVSVVEGQQSHGIGMALSHIITIAYTMGNV